MKNDIQTLLDCYSTWLKDRTKIREVEDYVEITTPYLDRHNDYLQIYAMFLDGGLVLTDDGYILDDLELSGCKIDSPKRQSIFHTILKGYGVEENHGALVVKVIPDNFSLKMHSLVQAMLAINDLFYLATSTATSLFYEEVKTWLDISKIRYKPNIKFTGKSGLDYHFDFVLPKSNMQPERILRAINHPDRKAAKVIAFSWIDVKEVRPSETRAYAILNDSKKTVSDNVMDAIRNYDVHPIRWSNRGEWVEELAA